MSATLTLQSNRIKREINDLSLEHEAKNKDITALNEALKVEVDPLRKQNYQSRIENLEQELKEIEEKVDRKEKSLFKLLAADGKSKFKEYFVKLNFELHKLAFKAYLDQDKKYGAFVLHSNIKTKQTWLFNNILLQYPQIGSPDNIWILKMGTFDIEGIDQLLDGLIEYMELEDDYDMLDFEEKLELCKTTIIAKLRTQSVAIVIYGASEVMEENEREEEEVALKSIMQRVWREIVVAIEDQDVKGWLINFFIDRTKLLNEHLSDDFTVAIDEEDVLAASVLRSIEEKKLLTLPEVKEITAAEFHKWVEEHLKKDELEPGYPFKKFHEDFEQLQACEAFLGTKGINAEKLFDKICRQFGFRFKEEQNRWEIL